MSVVILCQFVHTKQRWRNKKMNWNLTTMDYYNQFPQHASFKPDLCFSPMKCDQCISSVSAGGPSIGNPDHAQLAKTSLVSPSNAYVGGATNNSPPSQTPPPTTRETKETWETSMSVVWEKIQKKKLSLSPHSINVFMASWKKSYFSW